MPRATRKCKAHQQEEAEIEIHANQEELDLMHDNEIDVLTEEIELGK